MPSNELRAVLQAYGVRPRAMHLVTDNPRKPVWRIVNGQGEYFLKRMGMTPGRLRFVLAANEHLNRNGVRTPPVVPTEAGALYAEGDGTLYVLTRAVHGTEPSYEQHLELITRSLARFHAAGRGFVAPPDAEVHSHLGTWPDHMEKKLAELDAFVARARATTPPDPFLRTFLAEAGWFQRQIRDCLERIRDGRYQRWVEKVRAEGCLCHQDYAASNLRLVDGEVVVYDLDSVTHDLPARDLRKLFNKVMKKGRWDSSLARKMLAWYTEIYPLTADERAVLAVDLQFPHLFCGAVNKYFTGRAEDWSAAKLHEKLLAAIRADSSKSGVVSALTR